MMKTKTNTFNRKGSVIRFFPKMAGEPNGTYALFPSVLKKKKREENQLPVTVAIEQERVVLAWTIGLASCIKFLPPN